jgi:hypothetical protein
MGDPGPVFYLGLLLYFFLVLELLEVPAPMPIIVFMFHLGGGNARKVSHSNRRMAQFLTVASSDNSDFTLIMRAWISIRRHSAILFVIAQSLVLLPFDLSFRL